MLSVAKCFGCWALFARRKLETFKPPLRPNAITELLLIVIVSPGLGRSLRRRRPAPSRRAAAVAYRLARRREPKVADDTRAHPAIRRSFVSTSTWLISRPA